MAHLLEALERNLRETIVAYEAVLGAERAKVEHIVRCDSVGLLRSVEQQKPWAERLGVLESERLHLQSTAAEALGLGEGATIRQIAESVPPPACEALLEMRCRLIGILDELAGVHRSNAFLIGKSLEMLDEVLAAIFNHVRAGSTYERSGEVRCEHEDGGLMSRTL